MDFDHKIFLKNHHPNYESPDFSESVGGLEMFLGLIPEWDYFFENPRVCHKISGENRISFGDHFKRTARTPSHN